MFIDFGTDAGFYSAESQGTTAPEKGFCGDTLLDFTMATCGAKKNLENDDMTSADAIRLDLAVHTVYKFCDLYRMTPFRACPL